jgi:hypothetical protein
MILPKIDLPTFEFEIPSSGKIVKFRPFLVKEQKILLIALESGKEKDIVDAVKQIIQNCVIDKNFKVEEMATFDVEYFFIHLRARSIGEKVSMSFRCKNTTNEEECNHLMEFEHDLLSATIEKNAGHDKTVFFSNEVGVVMKYPSMNLTGNISKNKKKKSVEDALNMIVDSIDYIFDKDNLYYINEMKKEEILEYIENIPKTSFDKIQNFFNTIPYVKSNVEHKCEKCGFDHVIPLEGLTSFFE